MNPMNVSRVFAYLMALALTACGASNSNEGSASIIDGSGAPVPDIAVAGPIGGFGSVIVEGVHYQTDGASIYIDGEPANEQDLNLGDFISIQASYDKSTQTYSAKVILAETSVQGEVQAIDAERGEVMVLGQRISIEGETVFDEQFSLRGIAAIKIGDRIKVSGGSDGSGRIYATRISANPVSEASFAGYVVRLDHTAMTFELNGALVDYSVAGFAGYLRQYDWITVTGAFNDSGERFIATHIRSQQGPLPYSAGAQVRIEGLVENVYEGGFTLQGSPVRYSSATTVEGGRISDVKVGIKIALEGSQDNQRTIIAKRIRLIPNGFTEIYGAIERIDLDSADKFKRIETGTLVVGGKTIALDRRTIIGGFDGRRARLEEVRIGDNVYISAMPANAEGVYFARLLELGWRKGFMGERDT
ncbi:MAG: DUF5666 domain-containing protein, partial [Marinagarivorans sp.]|nr:DUF5666 domain-containing protein [Marinagarivorans sp.]